MLITVMLNSEYLKGYSIYICIPSKLDNNTKTTTVVTITKFKMESDLTHQYTLTPTPKKKLKNGHVMLTNLIATAQATHVLITV